MSYPTLLFYSPDGIVSRFNVEKEEEKLLQFVADRLPNAIIRLNRSFHSVFN